MTDVAVIGAGWAGLTAASRLSSRGMSVVVVDKARGPGGRCSTRRQQGFTFDHGAQYFTARTEAFARRVSIWQRAGLVAGWQPRIRVFGTPPGRTGQSPAERLVAVPQMNSILHRFSRGLDCRFGWRVRRVVHEDGWRLESEAGDQIEADALIVTAPPAQAAALLGQTDPLAGKAAAIQMDPCWALMLGLDAPVEVDFDAAFVNDGPLAWIARNSAKPQRSGGEAWVVHARSDWSREHLEENKESVAAQMLEALRSLTGGFARGPGLCLAHRWRYALAVESLHDAVVADDARKLLLAGDWCNGSRVEGAWTSGVAAARRMTTLLD